MDHGLHDLWFYEIWSSALPLLLLLLVLPVIAIIYELSSEPDHPCGSLSTQDILSSYGSNMTKLQKLKMLPLSLEFRCFNYLCYTCFSQYLKNKWKKERRLNFCPLLLLNKVFLEQMLTLVLLLSNWTCVFILKMEGKVFLSLHP